MNKNRETEKKDTDPVLYFRAQNEKGFEEDRTRDKRDLSSLCVKCRKYANGKRMESNSKEVLISFLTDKRRRN